MSLNHIPAAAVLAAMELDRADSKDELEQTWISLGCDAFKGRAREYVMGVYRQKCAQLNGHKRALDLARAI
jgi:hypothetical protein